MIKKNNNEYDILTLWRMTIISLLFKSTTQYNKVGVVHHYNQNIITFSASSK